MTAAPSMRCRQPRYLGASEAGSFAPPPCDGFALRRALLGLLVLPVQMSSLSDSRVARQAVQQVSAGLLLQTRATLQLPDPRRPEGGPLVDRVRAAPHSRELTLHC